MRKKFIESQIIAGNCSKLEIKFCDDCPFDGTKKCDFKEYTGQYF